MPASQAQIEANSRNAQRSCGPRSAEGKAQSRKNSFKHGLTGAGVVLPEEDAAEVNRIDRALQDEFQATGEAGLVLTRRMATLAVRMDRCVDQEHAALSVRIREAMEEFEAPEGVDAEEAERLRVEAGRRALFDTSKEACLARKYEAAAERGFFRAMKELDRLKKAASPSRSATEAERTRASLAQLGSFLPAGRPAAATPPPPPPKPVPAPSKPLPIPSKPVTTPSKGLPTGWDPFAPDVFHVPFAIGKPR